MYSVWCDANRCNVGYVESVEEFEKYLVSKGYEFTKEFYIDCIEYDIINRADSLGANYSLFEVELGYRLEELEA